MASKKNKSIKATQAEAAVLSRDESYKKWTVPVLAICAYFLLLIQGSLDNKLHESMTITALIVMIALVVLAWAIPRWRQTAKDRINIGTIMPFVYIFWCASSHCMRLQKSFSFCRF